MTYRANVIAQAVCVSLAFALMLTETPSGTLASIVVACVGLELHEQLARRQYTRSGPGASA